jgi:hypothetical protein
MTIRSTSVRFRPAALSSDPWRDTVSEPALSEVLSDPLVHQVMRRDGVSDDELAAVIAHAQDGLRRRVCCRLGN